MRDLIVLFATLTLLGLADCIAAGSATAQGSLCVPPGDEIYGELEHWRALGLWRGSLELRPMRRDALAQAVTDVAAAARQRELGAGDRRRLARLLALRDAWRLDEPPSAAPAGGPPVGLWEFEAALNYVGGPADLDSLPRLDRRPRRKGLLSLGLDAELEGRLAAQLHFYEDYSRFSRKPSGDGVGWVDNLPPRAGDVTQEPSARLDRAIIAYGENWFSLRFGREERRWGAGRRGSLFLSEEPFPLDGLSWHITTRYFSLASLFAQTQRGDQPLAENDSLTLAGLLPGDAYVACHRIELRPPGPLQLGLWEAAAYGGRGIDLAYANPVGFLTAITQDIWDNSRSDDKKVVGLDWRFDAAPVTVYGEFLIDRLVALDKAEDGDDSGISSYAQLLGLHWANPLSLSGGDLEVEYAHLDPQVYFHHDGDPRRALIRDDRLGEGRLLGHWLGPNADALTVTLGLPPHERLGRLSFRFERTRWGLIDGLRGDEIGFLGLKKGQKEWITGLEASETVLSAHWRRRDWALPIGRLDSDLALAWVGSASDLQACPEWTTCPGAPELAGDGWMIELRLDWRFEAWLR